MTVRELAEDAGFWDRKEVELEGIFLRGEFEFRGFVEELRVTGAGELAARGSEIYARLPVDCADEEKLWTKSPTGRSAWIRLRVRGRFRFTPEPTGPEPGYIHHLRIRNCKVVRQRERF